jgi:hypothetical protein
MKAERSRESWLGPEKQKLKRRVTGETERLSSEQILQRLMLRLLMSELAWTKLTQLGMQVRLAS